MNQSVDVSCDISEAKEMTESPQMTKEGSSMKRKRFFNWQDKEECWKKSPYMLGRHPDRWRLDAFGNPVNKFLKGCQGSLCYEYDHIVPFSKGGHSILENCQILGTRLNRIKSNKTELSYSEFKALSPNYNFSEEELDLIEKAVFGDIKRVNVDVYLQSETASEKGSN